MGLYSAMCLSCDPARIRTWDLQIRSLLLYPAELRGHSERKCIKNYLI